MIAAKRIVIEQIVENEERIICFFIDDERYLHATGSGICSMKKHYKDKRASCKKSLSISSNSQFVQSLYILLVADLEHRYLLERLPRTSFPDDPSIALGKSV